ncbi:hypothetical protein QFZ91_006048 [Paraburkholderia sp. JPY419]
MANDDNYRQGSIEVIKGRPQYYAMSNAFEIANCVAQYGRIVVGKNLRCGIDGEISAHWIRVTPPGLRSPKPVLTKTPPRHHRLLTTSGHLLTNNGPIGTIYSEWNT